MSKRTIVFVAILFIAIFAASCVKTPTQTDLGKYLETHIIGQKELVSGSPASLRVIAFDARGLAPVKDAEVIATFVSQQKRVELFNKKTDERGTVAVSYTVPADMKGNGAIEVDVKRNGAEHKETFAVNVKEQQPKLQLSTDKPIYQPGQTIHIKALALYTPTLEPVKKQKITVEVVDPKGNKVMKSEEETSQYGILGLDFNLAREINMGEYSINARGAWGAAQKKVIVKKYVLPKFKATLETGKKFYQAGDIVEGYVSARYFFGKPAAGAEVVVNIMTFDERLSKSGILKGKTDKDGFYRFTFKIPDSFRGTAYEDNKAYVAFEANVIDSTEHKEVVYHQYPVAKYPITVQAMPEGGRLVAKLENKLYLLTSYPDGTPAQCDLDIKFPTGNSRQLSSNSMGYCELPITPKVAEQVVMSVKALDKKGNKAEKPISLAAQSKEESILVRTDKSLYMNGDTVKIKVLSTQGTGYAYLDFIRGSQTIFTEALEINGGQGSTSFEVPQGLSGMVALNAYFNSPYTGIVQDSRTLYFAPRDLNISVKLDKESYRPGEEARLEFAITDKDNRPAPSALGVDIVDESLFAMFERRPGMEKVYFLIQPELLKGPYVLHGLSMSDFIQQPAEPQNEAFSKVVLAQAPQVAPYDLNQNSFAQKEQKILADLEKLENACINYRSSKQRFPDKLQELVAANLASESDIKDPWEREYVIEKPESTGTHEKAAVQDKELPGGPPIGMGEEMKRGLVAPWNPQAIQVFQWDETRPNVLCLGADGKKGTPDDLDYKSCYIARGPRPMPVATYEVEHRFAQGNQPGGAGMGMKDEAAVMKRSEEMAMAPQAMNKEKAQNLPEATQASLDGGAEPVKVREYFPETLLSKPEIITDNSGRAELTVPLADSITTWRMSALANSGSGQLGSTTSGLKVFQDFFIDLDLPVKLTQGDEVSIPVAIYNYLPGSQDIQLTLNREPWFDLIGSGETQKKTVGKEDVAVTSFRIKVKDVGMHKLTVTARGSSMSDAISREIEIEPDGKKYVLYKGEVIEGTGGSTSIEIPSGAIAGSANILLTLYPAPISQLVEGMDSVFRMPTGCFEQTSSATYPNVLVLDYLKKTKQTSPEVEKKAKEYINQGYQRLLGYEIKGGGFQVWGQPAATRVLSAYGLMEFSDMAKVHEVDRAVIERTKKWLLAQKEPDGSWAPDQSFAHGEQWGTIQSNNIPTTAYVTWAMAESGCKTEIADSIAYLKKNTGQIDNPYILALCVNAFLAVNPSDADAIAILDRLNGSRVEEGSSIFWKSDSLYSQGIPAQVETTSLIVYAMMKSGKYPDTVKKGLDFIVKSKDANGLWSSTQATIFAMRALLASQVGSNEPVNIAGDIVINGEKIDSFKVDNNNKDLFQQFELKSHVKQGNNTIKIDMKGKGSCAYRVAGIYYMPWSQGELAKKKELDIQVSYDRNTVKTSDSVKCQVAVKNLKSAYAPMVMVEVGTPPGFDVMTADIEQMVQAKNIQKFETYNDKVVLYLNGIENGREFKASYRLVAKYPLKAKTPLSMTYLYYNPEVNAICRPVTMQVM